MIMAKNVDLQPWLDYFELLKSYEANGLLDISSDKCEAFITAPALCTLAPKLASMGIVNMDAYTFCRRIARDFPDLVLRIRAYTAWKSKDGGSYLQRSFSLHVVKDERPYDLIYTILLTRRRRWWWPWRRKNHFETITY